MGCTKCKQKTSCNCPSEPNCQEDHSCKTNKDYRVYSKSRNTCGCKETCTCNSLTQQLDFKEIYYKGKQGCSNLESLGIEKGADLETIVELYGRLLISFNYFDFRDNIYEASDFTGFMDSLQEDINLLKLEITNLCEKYENIQLSLNTINTRLNKLEKPMIQDTRGLGFTVNDTIFKVLQKISSNG